MTNLQNKRPQLFTDAQFRKLLANADRAATSTDFNPMPVVKLSLMTGGTWLLTEVRPRLNIAYGLCEHMGYFTMRARDLDELASMRDYFGRDIERDRIFRPRKSISEYMAEACSTGAIDA